MSGDVRVDFSELENLQDLLETAVTRTAKERRDGLARAAQGTFDEAHANASGFTKGTGALAAALTLEGTDLTKIVGADVREAWFLEKGSPNTGAPRPWLTGPAESAITELLQDLGEAAEPW